MASSSIMAHLEPKVFKAQVICTGATGNLWDQRGLGYGNIQNTSNVVGC